MELGGAVPSMKTSWSLRFASTFLIPVAVESCQIGTALYSRGTDGCTVQFV